MILLLKSYPYHFVRTILSVPFCPIPFCPYTILSIPFCPYHFVRYHFVLEPRACSAQFSRPCLAVKDLVSRYSCVSLHACSFFSLTTAPLSYIFELSCPNNVSFQ